MNPEKFSGEKKMTLEATRKYRDLLMEIGSLYEPTD